MSPTPSFNRLSNLLQAAVDDARSLNRRRYSPNHAKWHSPTKKGKCEICLAGTILAVTYGINRDQVVIHECLGSELRPLAEALNLVRTGNWNLAFEIINFQPNTQELLDELHALPVPAHPHFYGWREFNHHLKSIEAALPRLRAIEEKFPAPPKPVEA